MSINSKLFKSPIYFIVAILIIISPIVLTALISVDTIVATATKKVGFLLFGFSFTFALVALFKPKVVTLILLPFAILVPVELYILNVLKSPASNGVIASVFLTNANEAKELLLSNVLYVLIAAFLFFVYIALIVKIPWSFKLNRKIRIALFSFFIFIQLLIVFRDYKIAKAISEPEKITETVLYSYSVKFRKTFPVNWVSGTFNYIEKSRLMKGYYKKIENFKFNAVETDALECQKVIVFVVGESARRSNFSLYGYHRETTPLLQKQSNLIVMRNAEALFNLTQYAYPAILSRATFSNFDIYLQEPSVIEAFNEAGFKTYYINNQPLGFGTIFQAYAQQADSLIDLSSSLDSYSSDEVIVPVFDKLLESETSKKIFIVVHSLGSHFRYNLRYPSSFEKYKPTIGKGFELSSLNPSNRDHLLNSYDNSILFTDYFITKLISALNSNPKRAGVLVYTSDHGENLFDDNNRTFGHGGTVLTRYEKEIPLFIWYSSSYESSFPEKISSLKNNIDSTVNTNHFFPSLIDLAGVTIDNEKPIKSFAYDKFKPLP